MGGSASHFGSEGKYYSFGNKGNYGMKNNSSVGQYTNRQYKDAAKMSMSNTNAIGLEEMVARELEAGIEGIAKIAPNIRKLIAPLINAAYRDQLNKGDINLKKVHHLTQDYGNPIYLLMQGLHPSIQKMIIHILLLASPNKNSIVNGSMNTHFCFLLKRRTTYP